MHLKSVERNAGCGGSSRKDVVLVSAVWGGGKISERVGVELSVLIVSSLSMGSG